MYLRIDAGRILTDQEKALIEEYADAGELAPDWEEGPDTEQGVESGWMGYGVYFIGEGLEDELEEGHPWENEERPSPGEWQQVVRLAGFVDALGLSWSIEGNGSWADSQARNSKAFGDGVKVGLAKLRA